MQSGAQLPQMTLSELRCVEVQHDYVSLFDITRMRGVRSQW